MSINLLNRYEFPLEFGQQSFILTGSASLYWPRHQSLIVADLHLEKGSYFAQRGNPLPLYDSLHSLQGLQQAISHFKPKTIISLGDNIHDVDAFKRMDQRTFAVLLDTVNSVEQWLWINGNHDQDVVPFAHPNFQFLEYYEQDGITFCHEPMPAKKWQIIGHYHPKIRCKSITGKCFVDANTILFMPSFGAYTGGLDVNEPAFQSIANLTKCKVFIVYRQKIWRVL